MLTHFEQVLALRVGDIIKTPERIMYIKHVPLMLDSFDLNLNSNKEFGYFDATVNTTVKIKFIDLLMEFFK